MSERNQDDGASEPLKHFVSSDPFDPYSTDELTPEQAREIVRVWLETEFAGGRHQRRVDKITAIERAARS